MNWKKVVSVLLVSAMTLSMAACGDTARTSDSAAGTESKAEASSDDKLVVWTLSNDLIDFGDKFQEATGVEVDTVVIEPADYPTKVQTALLAGEKEPDIIVGEPKMLDDFFDAGFFEDLNQAPYNAQDYADQIVDYVWQVGQDADGIQRAISYQITPAGIYYRRDIAKEVFGTDDIKKIQEQVSDWDKFAAAAETLKGKGYKMLSGYDDALRVYSNNVSQKCVNDEGVIQIDPSIEKWIDTTKEYTDKGYNNGTSLWAEEWTADMGKDSKVFGYFMPAWGINFSMAEGSGAKKNDDGTFTPGGSYGDWAVVTGPQSFNWGGSFICGAAGTDNAKLVADIMKKLCCDKDIMFNISKDTSDFVNNKAANKKLEEENVTSDFLGGQSLVKALSSAADNINCSNVSPYDQMYIESLMAKMKDYYQGKVSKEKAIDNFKNEVIKSYPDLKK